MRVHKDAVATVLMEELDNTPQNVALALSGGIDSLSVMFTLLRLGRSVTAYSFRLDAVQSSDFSEARTWAARFDVKFVPIVLPVQVSRLKDDIRELVDQYGLRRKTDIECAWAFLYLIPAVTESVLVTGSASDGHFGISKKAMIHFRHSAKQLDDFRRMTFGNPNYAQQQTVSAIGKESGVDLKVPYASRSMQELFMGTEWEDINKPKQKQSILESFDTEFASGKVRPHTNLQLGDSKIAEHFTKLLTSDWNVRNHKSVVGIYNDVAKGAV
jgi:asparagine synthetase B (glutamine-hydrolysing)